MATTVPLILSTGLLAMLGMGAAIWRFLRHRPLDMAPAGAQALPVSPPRMPAEAVVRDGEASTADPTADARIIARFHEMALGGAPANAGQTDAATTHAVVMARAASVLAQIETQTRYTPRRPQLLPQLTRAVNDADASVRAIADVIAQDPTLAGNLLRIANSALYRVQSKPVESIERAVTLVGSEGLRLLIAAALVQPVVGTSDGVFGRFPTLVWEHTLLSAVAAAEQAKRVEHEDPFAAQLAALLDGLGAIVVVQVVRDAYARHPGLAPDHAVAATLLEAWAGPTAAKIAQSWGLSDRIVSVLETPPGEGDGGLDRALHFGRVAGGLAMLFGQGLVDEDEALTRLAGFGGRADITSAIWWRLRGQVDGS